MNFEDRVVAMIWILDNQFGRRNLSDVIRVELALKRKDIIATRAKMNQLSSLKQNSVCQKSDKRESIDTKKEVAKLAGISHDTVSKVEDIIERAHTFGKRKCT